jgi:hypothetical protein
MRISIQLFVHFLLCICLEKKVWRAFLYTNRDKLREIISDTWSLLEKNVHLDKRTFLLSKLFP